MKKTCLLLLMLTWGIVWSQETTMDEYNYLTKGYQIQMSSGLDTKQGYKFIDQGTYPLDAGGYQLVTTVRYLWRTTNNSYAGAIVMIHNSKNNITNYFCVPTKNSGQDMWNLAMTDFRKVFGGDIWGCQAMMYAMMHSSVAQ
jgi:hypothetical protein